MKPLSPQSLSFAKHASGTRCLALGERAARKAFTLVELLVTISIIGVLAVLGLVGMAKIREAGDRVKCVQSLRQVHHALMAYVNDLNGVFPSVANYPSYASWARNWDYELVVKKYVEDWDAFRCPSAPPTWACSGFYIHYGYNTYLPPAEGTASPAKSFGRLANVRQPAETVMLADSCFSSNTNPVSGFYTIAAADRIHGRHKGKANVAFVDGHIESLEPGSSVNATSPLRTLSRKD